MLNNEEMRRHAAACCSCGSCRFIDQNWISSKNYWQNVHNDVVGILEGKHKQLTATEDEIKTPW